MPAAEKMAWYGAFLLLTFLVGCVQIEDPDIWWHLRTGQLIYLRGEVPQTDWFTYTNPDSPWIDLHWGFQLVVAGLWAMGGAPALVLCKSLLATATFLLGMLAVRREWPAWQTVVCWLPALLIFSARNQVRPEMFSLLFLAADLAIVFHARTRPRLVWLLPVIQVLWINVHGLFVLGLIVWFSFVIGEAAREGFGRDNNEGGIQPQGVTWRRWMMVSVLMAAAALANPYTVEGALLPLTLLRRLEGADHAFYSLFSGEFLSIPELLSLNGFATLFRDLTPAALCSAFVLSALSFTPRAVRRRLDPFRLVVFILFGWLAWKANRNWAVFAIVSGVVLRANVGEWLAVRSISDRFARTGRMLAAAALGVLLVGVPLDLLSVTRLAEVPRLFGVGEIPSVFPHAAAGFLGRPGMPRRCYAIDEGAAAVYIFHNGPDRKVFADARLEVNTHATLERYLAIEGQIITGDPRLLQNLREGIPPDAEGRVELPAIMISLRYLASNKALQSGLSRLNAYRRVFVDNCAVVFIEQRQAERLGLPSLGLSPAR